MLRRNLSSPVGFIIFRRVIEWVAAAALLFSTAATVCAQVAEPPAAGKSLQDFKQFLQETTPKPQPAREEAATTGKMRIRVTDSQNHAIPGAKLHASVWTHEKGFKANQDYTCDAQGQAEIALPKTIEIVRIWARKERFVPLWTQWWPKMQADGDQIPEEFTFRLSPGTTMGGIVCDEEGKPIKDVTIEAMLQLPPEGFNGDKQRNVVRPGLDVWLAEGDTALKTDGEGRWLLECVPADDQHRVSFKLTHPAFISDETWGVMQTKQNISTKDLRAGTSRFAMERGVRVTGTVTDQDNKPVKDAVVIWGDDPYFQHRPQQEVLTDKEGVYRFPPLPARPLLITVVAKDWMPELREVITEPEMMPVDFHLKRGKTMRIKFVDSSGAPVPKVSVSIGGWRGAKSLYNYKHANVVDTKIPRQANDQGIYEWTWAPDDEVSYSFSTDRSYVDKVKLTADGEEHRQTFELGPAGVDK
jgi:hypothetical protein